MASLQTTAFKITLPKKRLHEKKRLPALKQFAEEVYAFNESLDLDFKLGARSWGYVFENHGLIDKPDIERAGDLINKAREEGFLPAKFTADDETRKAVGVETVN